MEGAAGVYFQDKIDRISPGEELHFSIRVKDLATVHKFPTGSVEERDVWLHVSLNDDKGKEILHIPVAPNSDDLNDKYFITSNAKVAYPFHSTLSDPIERDGLPEGDRIYHSAFIDSEGEFTYAQWLCVEEIENRCWRFRRQLARLPFNNQHYYLSHFFSFSSCFPSNSFKGTTISARSGSPISAK